MYALCLDKVEEKCSFFLQKISNGSACPYIPGMGLFALSFFFCWLTFFFSMYKRDGTRVGEFDIHKHQGESEA